MPASTFMPAGNVVGPLSSTDSGLAQYDGTTGQLIKNHAATVAIGSEVSGLATGVASALGTAVNTAGGPVTNGGNIGAATGTSLNVSGNVRAASFNVGATAGVDASIVIPAVATITVSKGIITSVA